jgi:hypothetical protein
MPVKVQVVFYRHATQIAAKLGGSKQRNSGVNLSS